MRVVNLQKPLQILRLLRSPLHRKEIDDLNKQQRFTAARFLHRVDQLPQPRNEPIVADPQQWTTRNVAHARRFNDEHARTSFSKAAIPIEVLLRHKAVFGRTPRHHRGHPRAAPRFERTDLHRTKQSRTCRFVSRRPRRFFYLVSDWTCELPHLSHSLHDSGTFTSGGLFLSDDLLKWRREFPILDKTVYLISHSLGAMPRATYDRLHEYADVWATRGVRAWAEGWWDMPVTVGDEIARIIGGDPGSVVMHQNVSICESLILSCLEPTPERNKIVYSELNFPSVMYVYEADARDGRLRIEKVKSDDGVSVPLERMLEAIDESTLLVPFSHVLFKSAFLQDARAIIDRAHEVGALVVLDTYQSAGTVPFSVKELNADFATGGSVKWLCGGPGAGYLYVRPDLQTKLQPKTTGWMAHEQPFAFDTDMHYAPNITRFLHGSPAIPALYAAQSGYKIINTIGVDRIREKR